MKKISIIMLIGVLSLVSSAFGHLSESDKSVNRNIDKYIPVYVTNFSTHPRRGGSLTQVVYKMVHYVFELDLLNKVSVRDEPRDLSNGRFFGFGDESSYITVFTRPHMLSSATERVGESIPLQPGEYITEYNNYTVKVTVRRVNLPIKVHGSGYHHNVYEEASVLLVSISAKYDAPKDEN